MPASTSADLHAHADALWRSTHPGDLAAARYADAAALLLSARPGAHRRATKWLSALHRYEDHWRDVGHTPREKTRAMASLSAEERNLGEWARYQRRFEDQLNAYQRARLDVSPASSGIRSRLSGERGSSNACRSCRHTAGSHVCMLTTASSSL